MYCISKLYFIQNKIDKKNIKTNIILNVFEDIFPKHKKIFLNFSNTWDASTFFYTIFQWICSKNDNRFHFVSIIDSNNFSLWSKKKKPRTFHIIIIIKKILRFHMKKITK